MARIMEKPRLYELPRLDFGYGDLAPHISEEQLKIHHSKHHQAYVNSANALMEKMDKARREGTDLDMKAALKELSFHLGGHELHTAFWRNLAPPGRGGGGRTDGLLGEAIEKSFGNFERLKREFTQAAVSVEGSGWAMMTYCDETDRLGIMQVEKHNCNLPPDSPALMVLDVWEHAYYLDYKNDRASFVEAFWNIVNWSAVNDRFTHLHGFLYNR